MNSLCIWFYEWACEWVSTWFRWKSEEKSFVVATYPSYEMCPCVRRLCVMYECMIDRLNCKAGIVWRGEERLYWVKRIRVMTNPHWWTVGCFGSKISYDKVVIIVWVTQSEDTEITSYLMREGSDTKSEVKRDILEKIIVSVLWMWWGVKPCAINARYSQHFGITNMGSMIKNAFMEENTYKDWEKSN